MCTCEVAMYRLELGVERCLPLQELLLELLELPGLPGLPLLKLLELLELQLLVWSTRTHQLSHLPAQE